RRSARGGIRLRSRGPARLCGVAVWLRGRRTEQSNERIIGCTCCRLATGAAVLEMILDCGQFSLLQLAQAKGVQPLTGRVFKHAVHGIVSGIFLGQATSLWKRKCRSAAKPVRKKSPFTRSSRAFPGATA